MTSISTTPAAVNCSNPKEVYIDIDVDIPIPSFGATIFGVYFLPIIIIFGVAGNIISLIILRRAAKKISSHFYLWWMAVFDVISLLSYIPTSWAIMLVRPYYYHIYGPRYPATWIEFFLLGKYVCRIRMFFTFAARTCSIYTIVIVTVERFIMVVFPMKRTKLCTMYVAKISISVMTVISILFTIPWFFTFDIQSKPCFPLGICNPNNILFINMLIESIILSLIPCVIIVVCNGTIIYTLRGRLRLNLLVDTLNAKKQERDITIRLLAVSFAFFFLTIPSLVLVSIQAAQYWFDEKTYIRGAEADASVLSIILFAINLAINFIIYCLTGKNFRTAALALIKCNLKDMRKYRSYLVTESTSANTNDRNINNSQDGNFSRKLENKDSIMNRDSFQQKRVLIESNV